MSKADQCCSTMQHPASSALSALSSESIALIACVSWALQRPCAPHTQGKEQLHLRPHRPLFLACKYISPHTSYIPPLNPRPLDGLVALLAWPPAAAAVQPFV